MSSRLGAACLSDGGLGRGRSRATAEGRRRGKRAEGHPARVTARGSGGLGGGVLASAGHEPDRTPTPAARQAIRVRERNSCRRAGGKPGRSCMAGRRSGSWSGGRLRGVAQLSAPLGRTDPVGLLLCVEGTCDLLPVRAERDLERLHDPAAQHAVPCVALEREHGGGAAADGDWRIVLYRQCGHEAVEESGLVRKSQCEASTIHAPATLGEHTFVSRHWQARAESPRANRPVATSGPSRQTQLTGHALAQSARSLFCP